MCSVSIFLFIGTFIFQSSEITTSFILLSFVVYCGVVMKKLMTISESNFFNKEDTCVANNSYEQNIRKMFSCIILTLVIVFKTFLSLYSGIKCIKATARKTPPEKALAVPRTA
eukprot:TRINITY_DN8181_c0_g4_i1.p2 TRINITY_DN8181_c0_g4~~TRINITY_DN8181_c0_g4_i1.p2  ORF type:complete len:113 (+),score=18.59 TRINITY_DN8181_c0_g4_i1:590-928(+)